jgi:MinD-like ATPase involved in chromosome partitioning or flagellar assembly
MYTVTFYSFKGGVGRSMALVNVAVELATRGRRVLMVDFDLEAPGLDTFNLARPRGKTPGLIDLICQYRNTFEVPDVCDFIYKSPVQGIKGELWVMPAGGHAAHYDEHFKSVDWNRLYEEEDGFILFEDLKAQWSDSVRLDYVLIDSRTGHTDIGGICTRQLPDAVVLLFFPNEQNRRGLETVIKQIRDEETGPLKKSIDLHFVMANVPDLDDEQEILAANVSKFRDTLQYDRLATTIHHYNSLTLLDQAVFAIDRPRSRLACEYRELTSAIIRGNLADRDGAVDILDDLLRRGKAREIGPAVETRLQQIRTLHSQDAEILKRLARLRRRQRRPEEALSLIEHALTTQPDAPDLLLSRAELRALLGTREDAVADLTRLMALPHAPANDLAMSLRLLRELSPDLVGIIGQSPALQHLEVDFELIHELEKSLETLSVAEKLLRSWLTHSTSPPETQDITMELALVLIGECRFGEAKTAITPTADPNTLEMQGLFNYTMAEWGERGVVPRKLFEDVIRLHSQRKAVRTANYEQCLALAHWATGEGRTADALAQHSLELIETSREWSFSAWSYLTLSPRAFVDDVEEMKRMFKGEALVPRFIRRGSSGPQARPS